MSILNDPAADVNPAIERPELWGPATVPGDAREWGPDPAEDPYEPTEAERRWWAEESARMAERRGMRDYYAATADDPRWDDLYAERHPETRA